MALTLYCGRPGAGKSYSVVEYVVIPALLKGRTVVTNIPLFGDMLVQVYGGEVRQLPQDALGDPDLPDHVPHGSVVIVDECWHRWPSGQKVSQAPHQDLKWLKEHRHRVDVKGNAMQVVLVTQDPSDLASWVRKLIAHSFHMCKLEEIGASNKFNIKVYKGCPTGEKIPARYLVREAIGSYKPEITRFYSSATQSKTFDVGDEKVMDKRTNVFGSASMLAIFAFCALAFTLGPYMLYSYVKGKTPAEVEKEIATEVELVNPLPEVLAEVKKIDSPKPVNPPPAEPSSTWRIAGYLKRNHPDPEKMADTALLTNMSGGIRYVALSTCNQYPNSFDYSCQVDGQTVTPWSGKMGLTQGFQESAGLTKTVDRLESSL